MCWALGTSIVLLSMVLETGAEALPAWRLEAQHLGNASAPVDLGTLLAICLRSRECKHAYHLNPRAPNAVVFRHLLPTGALDKPLFEPLQTLMESTSPEAANEALWLLRLSAYRRSVGYLCDVNHEIVFDQQTLQSSCVCKPDATCSDELYTLLPFWIALGLAVVLGLLLFAGVVYSKKKQLDRIEAIGNNEGDKYRILFMAFN